MTALNFAALPKIDAPHAKCENTAALAPSWRRALSSLSELTRVSVSPASRSVCSIAGAPGKQRNCIELLALERAQAAGDPWQLPPRHLEAAQDVARAGTA